MKRVMWNLVLLMSGFISGGIFIIYRCGYILENKQRKMDKYYSYFIVLERWMSYKEKGYEICSFFEDNHVQSVAIYGMGKIGQHLKYELDRSGIKLAYVVDQGESVIYGKEKHYNLYDNLPLVDMIIVTPINEFTEIKDKILNNNKKLKVVSIEELFQRD